MAQLLVRDVDADTVERLKERAKKEGRSLGAELKLILEKAAHHRETSERDIEAVRALFDGKIFSDSTELLREDRER